MNDILKMVYGNQKEVKLESQIIELADFADVKTQEERANKSYQTFLDFSNKLYQLQNEAKKILPKELELLNRYQRELKSDLDKFLSRLDSLGIKPNEVKQPKQYQDAIDKIKNLEDRASKMYNDFK